MIQDSLHSEKVSGESVSADVKAADELETRGKLIAEENNLPEHILNTDGTSLFWKWMPERTSIHKQAKQFQVSRLLRQGNSLVWGQRWGYKLKSFVIWHPEDPRVNHTSKHTPPVYCRSNMSWITEILFQHAILNCYASTMKKYCLENNIPVKVLLIADNIPKYPPFIGDLIPISKRYFSLQTSPLLFFKWEEGK